MQIPVSNRTINELENHGLKNSDVSLSQPIGSGVECGYDTVVDASEAADAGYQILVEGGGAVATGTIAAAGLGGLLLKLLTSTPVRDLLWSLISGAFSNILG
jgi:hypothetical protein